MDATTANTKAALFAFLKKAETTGLYKANTVGGLRAAATKLLEDLDDSDDVRNVDAQKAAHQYHNRHPSELSSASLAEYQRRLGRLLDEFTSFNENPAGYSPKGRISRKPTNKSNDEDADNKPQKSRDKKVKKTKDIIAQPAAELPSRDVQPIERIPMLRLSYPIRDDVLAEIAVPRGMSTDEAKRICAFIMTLAKDFAPN